MDREALEEENRRLREALKPFAAVSYASNTFNRAELSDTDFRRARAALAAEPASGEAVSYVPNRDEKEEWDKICAPPPASGEVGEHRWIWPDHMLRARIKP
jgi:hypothetical protein